MKSALNQQSKRYCSQRFCYTTNSCKPWSPLSSTHNYTTHHHLQPWKSKGCCVCAPHRHCGRLLQPQIWIKSSTQSYIAARSTELLHVTLFIPWIDSRAEDNTLVPHMPGSCSNQLYSSWLKRKAAKCRLHLTHLSSTMAQKSAGS